MIKDMQDMICNVIMFINENGIESILVEVVQYEIEGKDYVLTVPCRINPDDAKSEDYLMTVENAVDNFMVELLTTGNFEVIFFEIEYEEGGYKNYREVEDEEEWQRVFEYFMKDIGDEMLEISVLESGMLLN